MEPSKKQENFGEFLSSTTCVRDRISTLVPHIIADRKPRDSEWTATGKVFSKISIHTFEIIGATVKRVIPLAGIGKGQRLAVTRAL
jgi:hypothetical protein